MWREDRNWGGIPRRSENVKIGNYNIIVHFIIREETEALERLLF